MAKKVVDDSGLNQLKKALKTGEFHRLYFFFGEERYLQEYYLSALRKKIVSGPMEEFNYRRLTAENMSMEALQDAVEAMPMMAERIMVQVDDYDPFAQPEDIREQLCALFSDLPETCTLVFYFDTVAFSRNEKMKKLMTAVREYGVSVEFPKQTTAALVEWIGRHFRQQGKTISPELCQHLIFLTGGDMTTLHSEIEKVSAFSRMTEITRQDIDTVVEPVLTAVVFDITDALAEDDYDKALLRLRGVLQTKEDPLGILGAVGGHFRRLMTAHTVVSAGHGPDTLKALLGSKSDYFMRKIMAQTRRIPEATCRKALQLCYETDFKMKRSFDDNGRLLETLLLTLAQEGKA